MSFKKTLRYLWELDRVLTYVNDLVFFIMRFFIVIVIIDAFTQYGLKGNWTLQILFIFYMVYPIFSRIINKLYWKWGGR